MSNEPVLTLVGNLTADPDLKYTSNGAAVENFTVASTPRTYDKARGEWVDGEPLFMRCSLWREAAENVAESLKRGQRVIVTGKLKSRSYDKDGVKKTVVELEVEDIGPSVRYAVVVTDKKGAAKPKPVEDDPWGAAPANSTDEPPF
jgi:single-strand DNA-binding protein